MKAAQMKRQTSYAYLGTREIVEAFSPFNIFLCIQYCVVGNASLEVRAMALKRVAHTRGNNVCFRYGDRTLVRPFLMPLGSSRASKALCSSLLNVCRKLRLLSYTCVME